MGQTLHPVIIFKGGGEIAEYEEDERKPGRPKKIKEPDAANDDAAGPALLHQDVPVELHEAVDQELEQEARDPLDQADLDLINAALVAETEPFEEVLPADLPFKRRVKGRLARRPSSMASF